MLRSLLFAAGLFGLAPNLSAAPCVAGTLDTYISAACSSFGITFGTWTYSAGGTLITPSDILVFPSVAGPVFEFTVTTGTGWSAGPGVTVTPSIAFSATSASTAVGAFLFLAFGTTSGTGTVSAALNQCLGDLFTGGCVGTAASIAVTPPSLLATNPFGASFSTIDLQLNMTISGGSGSAQISSMEAGLGAVPEPGTMSLVALGLAWVGLRRHFRKA